MFVMSFVDLFFCQYICMNFTRKTLQYKSIIER